MDRGRDSRRATQQSARSSNRRAMSRSRSRSRSQRQRRSDLAEDAAAAAHPDPSIASPPAHHHSEQHLPQDAQPMDEDAAREGNAAAEMPSRISRPPCSLPRFLLSQEQHTLDCSPKQLSVSIPKECLWPGMTASEHRAVNRAATLFFRSIYEPWEQCCCCQAHRPLSCSFSC